MAKRYQPLKEFSRTTKKPKLDITVGTSTTRTNGLSAGGQSNVQRNAVKSSPNNFWDDDDDDVILLATQVAESQVAAAAAGARVMEMTNSEITFSEFAPHVAVHASTSTQMPAPAPLLEIPDQDVLSAMFGDDNDDDFPPMPNKPHKIEEPTFKRPALTGPSNGYKPSGPSAPVAKTDTISSSQFMGSQPESVARRQLASELKIKFLTERVDALKKENFKLTTDLSDTKAKMESKEGEATLLRDELRHLKQQMQTLKMEKIFSTEAAKTECKSKIAELAKQVAAKETELQLKSVQFSVLKIRHADETRRMEMTMRNDSMLMSTQPMPQPDTASKECEKTEKEKLSLIRLRLLNFHDKHESEINSKANMNALVYEQSHERGSSKRQRTLFQLELESMQTIVAQFQLKQNQHVSEQAQQAFIDQTIGSVRKVFPEFWSYAHSLEFPKNCRIHPYHSYDLLKDASAAMRQSLSQPSELHQEERALSLRRYIAALSVICQQLPSLANALISYRHGEYALLQIVTESICKLGFSRELVEHFGLIEAFATLLHTLLMNLDDTGDAQRMEYLFGLLKQLIFTRPSPWIFREISFCVLKSTELPNLLSLFCENSAGSNFLTDRVRSTYRFTSDSCMIQVYAGLLEIAFPLNAQLSQAHFDLLTVICLNHVRFVYYCFANPPKFIHNLLPPYDDDDNEDDMGEGEQTVTNAAGNSSPVTGTSVESKANQSTNRTESTTSNTFSSVSSTAAGSIGRPTHSPGSCECYTKLCLSVVTLLFILLRQWMRTEKSMKTIQVAEISKISVQLLYIIFCENYITRLFRDEEETTKHYLSLICKWWLENSDALLFNHIHKDFLEKLQSSHVMPRKLSHDENLAKVPSDLRDWYNITNDDHPDRSNIASASDTAAAALRSLQLMESAGHSDEFFEGLKGYAFNFE